MRAPAAAAGALASPVCRPAVEWIVPTRRPPGERVALDRPAGASPSVIRASSTWSARAASAEIRSSSVPTVPRSSSEVAISASSDASRARRRERAARSLTTIAVTTKTASANQFLESASVNVCTGGRKNQLKASMLATETAIA